MITNLLNKGKITLGALIVTKMLSAGCSDGITKKVEAWHDFNQDGTKDAIVSLAIPSISHEYAASQLDWVDGTKIKKVGNEVYIPRGTRKNTIGTIRCPIEFKDTRAINVKEKDSVYKVYARWCTEDGFCFDSNPINYKTEK